MRSRSCKLPSRHGLFSLSDGIQWLCGGVIGRIGVGKKLRFLGWTVYSPTMKKIIDVNTGQVKVGRGNVVLRSLAIGSCIAAAAYDCEARIGAVAHIMLPGRAPEDFPEKTRYAEDAVEELIGLMVGGSSRPGNLDVCLVGAGNVLQKADDTICMANIRSTMQAFEQRDIPIRATALCGTDRKSIFLEIATGKVSYTQGGRQKDVLWMPA